jgi:hypothetical protein
MAGSTNGNGTAGRKRIDLDALPDDAGEMKIAGEWRRVVQLDGPGWEIYDRMRGIVQKAREGEAPPDALSTQEFYDLAARCLPDTPREIAWGMIASKAGLVIAMASSTLEAVEESVPKAEAPTEGETATPSSA